jgi:hypothetical protein
VSGPAESEQRRPRRPLVAVVLSGLFPGLGQWYNRELGKAVLFALGGVLTGFGPWNPLDVDIDPAAPAVGLEHVLLASLPFLAVALWSVVDAYRVARRSSAV